MNSIPASVSALMEMAKQVNAYFDGPLTNALLTGTDTEWESCHSQHQQQLHKLRGLAKMATLCGTTITIMTAEKTVDEDEGESWPGYIYSIWQGGTRYWIDGRIKQDNDSLIDGELHACRCKAEGHEALADTVKFNIWDF